MRTIAPIGLKQNAQGMFFVTDSKNQPCVVDAVNLDVYGRFYPYPLHVFHTDGKPVNRNEGSDNNPDWKLVYTGDNPTDYITRQTTRIYLR